MPLFPILAILVTTAAATPYPNSSLSRASVTTTPVYEGQCPHPFTAVEGEHCYFLSYGAIRQTWKNAQLFCRWIHPGSRLAEFETPEELNVATQFLTTDYLEGALTLDHNWPSVGPWIGAIEIGNTGLFAWASDMKTPILGTCTNWAASKPQGLSTPEDAVALQPPYFNWVDFQNDLELPFICEVKANPRPVVVPQNCPSGFTKLSTGCYNFVTTSRSWDSSQSYCRSLARGSKLAEFETEEENYVVVYYMVRYKPCENYWIGGEEYKSSNFFRWASNYNPVTFYEWHDGEPNDSASNNALGISCRYGWQWYDHTKTASGYSICEAPFV